MSPVARVSPDRRLPIRALGELQVGPLDTPRVLPASRKTRALLAYLAVTARRHQRSKLCALFWEDAADPRAGLRWSLTQLRHALGDADRDVIVADRESVQLRAGRTDTDLARLAESVGPDPTTATREALLAGGALFRGEFLEGLDLPACYAYHEWCMAERESASRAREQILVALIERDRGHPQRILAHARTLVARNPLNERGHIELISALAALGRGRDARAQHAQCCRIFETELGLGPPAGLDQALAALDACKAPVRDDSAAGAPVSAAQVVGVRARAALWPR